MKKSESTKQRILKAATELFAEQGYHATTHQMMSDKAKVNIAAINYHFGSKENLYLKVWEFLADIGLQDYKDFIRADDSPEEQLRSFIKWRVKAVTDTGLRGCLSQIGRWEMNKPSSVHEQIEVLYMKEKRAWFYALIREIVGHDLDAKTIAMLSFCVYSPLLHLIEVKGIMQTSFEGSIKEQFAGFWDDIDALAANIYTFAIAGLKQVSADNQEGG